MAHLDAHQIAFAGICGYVRKIKIENDLGLVDTARNDEVGIHHSVIVIDHEIWIEPVVKRPVAFSDCAGLCFGAFAHNRTPLQAEALAVFDHVVAVIEHAVETLVQMRHMVTTIKIIIDENLPVAVEGVMTPFQPLQVLQLERADLIHQIRAEKTLQRRHGP